MDKRALDYFNTHLPYKPYCTDDLHVGLRILPQAQALLKRYIQPNPPHAMSVLAFDLDYQGGAIGWDDYNAPPFNISAMNRKNAHAHGFYCVKTAIRTAPDGSIKALKYAAAIERALCLKLNADPRYGGLICKNPNHADWQVTQWRAEPYTLDELADYVDLSASPAPIIDLNYGLGRNCTIFEKTRQWAYKAIKRGWPDLPQWFEACFDRALAYNLQFPAPLGENEVKAIARSISKWTYQRFNASEFSRIQAIRGAKGGRKANNWHEAGVLGGKISHGGGRPIVARSIEQLKPWEALGISRRMYYYRKQKGIL